MKLQYKAYLDINALLEKTKIKKHILFHSPFDFYSDYKFIGKYDKNDNLLLNYVNIAGTMPLVNVSKTNYNGYDIKIEFDKVTKFFLIFEDIFLFALILFAIIYQIFDAVIFLVSFFAIMQAGFVLFFKWSSKKNKKRTRRIYNRH